ncbi:amidohydrolase family protein [Granulicella sp. dw_53]|uniref:amidohydrolase family protein n=1 Tax=Granulicella sp. dw_53 TaxID=2719792 RepID=UPI0021085FD0|nr:amidohydrolase family protein [Granulicella sp. dw_53]
MAQQSHLILDSKKRSLAMPLRRLATLLLATILVPAALAQQPAVALHNATLIDGTGAEPRPHTTILMGSGLILSVQPDGMPLKGFINVDLHGATVIPGLISAHSHLGLLSHNASNSATAYTPENVHAALDQYEHYGVTTIISLGLNRDLVYDIRSQQRTAFRNGTATGALLLTAGRGIGAPNGAPPIAAAPDQVYRPTTPAQARQQVDELAIHHADIVKIWVDPLHGKAPAMDPAIYTAIIEEAHRNHLRVAAHEYALQDAQQLVTDGIDVLAHSVRDKPVDEPFIQSVLRHHTWYIPTFTVDESFYIYADHPDFMKSQFFRKAAGSRLLGKIEDPSYATSIAADPSTAVHRQDFAIAQRNLKTLYDAGALIAFGTDSGAMPGRIPGFSEHRELEDLVAAGLTPLQAITLATGRTGQLLHTLDPTVNLGLIAPGYSADLVVLSADPLADIRNTRHIQSIYHAGRGIPNPAPTD